MPGRLVGDHVLTSPAAPRGMLRLDRVRVAQLLFPLGLLAGWQVMALVLGDFFVPTPAATLAALRAGVAAGWLGENFHVTMTALVYGYALAAGLGVAIGFLLGLSRFTYAVFQPIVVSLYALPKITLFPVFLFVFGLGISSKAWLGISFGIFPIIMFTMNGTRNVNPILLKVGRSLRLSQFKLFRAIVFPAILPSLAAGLRLGFGVTFLGVVLSEMFASRHGLGFLLVQSVSLHDMPKMYGLIALLTLIAFTINGAFLLWEWLLTRRRPDRAVPF